MKTNVLYREALQKFEIFHIAIDDREDCYSQYRKGIRDSFGKLLKDRFLISTLDKLPQTILNCLEKSGVGTEKAEESAAGASAISGLLFSGVQYPILTGLSW